jgi:hypothetical protein
MSGRRGDPQAGRRRETSILAQARVRFVVRGFISSWRSPRSSRTAGALPRVCLSWRIAFKKAAHPEISMNPIVSPRHPLKAIAVVLAMFVVVHGARAHIGPHEHGFSHVHIVHASPSDPDCPDIDIDEDDDPDDATFIDVIDGDTAWT